MIADNVKWTLYDLSDRLLMKGWQLPTYPLPKDLDNIVIQRIFYRADLGYNMAEDFIEDFNNAITKLDKAHILFYDKKEEKKVQGFTH